ncbi:hypothetical protein VB715_07525 [Crocosphaera sp. UHCC 0190]|uniref:hypothetical protein n=1 Tax=Crocosphaera sp. UHCC 0190 TaxID=3110246 RepID=UPI002B1F9689|nr:hypothetical protein [Crocosphaera sp. UHCC 0190]MEA5509610.1 hypothetical protein [Crocosphaera sp. UHCC 0190]
MKIINKVKILAAFTTLVLAFGNQSAFSSDLSQNLLNQPENEKSDGTKTEFIQANAFIPSSTKALQVNDSLIHVPVPQPLIILCVLGLAGLSGFLKLKIAQAKYQQIEEETYEFPELVKH